MKLYQHQNTALNLLRLNDGFALFMEQGTGKSFPILYRISELIEQGKIRNAVIVAPKAVMSSWHNKIEQLDKELKAPFEHFRLDIVSYDSLWRDKYKNLLWDCVVLDEAHYIKNYKAKRTKACLKKCQRAKYRYILTGTPTSNGQLCNLYSLSAAIYPTTDTKNVYPVLFDGMSYSRWLNKYAYLNQYYQPWKYHNVDELQARIKAYSYRVTKVECLDLPSQLPNEVWTVDMNAKQKSLYKNIAKESADIEHDILADNPLVRSLRLRQIASGFVGNDKDEIIELNSTKTKTVIDYLKEREKKTVIFCEFRHSIDSLSSELNKAKIKHVIIDGRIRDKEVSQKFQSNKSLKVCICQYASGSAGIDLYEADTIIFYEPTLSSNLHEQARDRIHRIGQRQCCSYYYLMTKGSIEFAIYQALNNYSDFNKQLFTQYLSTYTKGENLNDRL